MRSVVMTVVVLVACKGTREQERTVAMPPVARPVTAVPQVSVATVLAADDGKAPPFLVVLDAAGTVHLTAVATWPELASRDLLAGAKTGAPDTIERFVRWAADLKQSPRAALAEVKVRSLDEHESPLRADPGDLPPPDDELSEEAGGTGEMALDRSEDERAARLAREAAAAAEHAARRVLQERTGRRGSLTWYEDWGTIGERDDSLPQRLARVAGEVVADRKLDPLRALVVVPPSAPARKLIEVVALLEGAIAVEHAGRIRPLRIQFAAEPDPAFYTNEPARWIEVRVSTRQLVLEAVPDVPHELASLEPAALAAAISKLSKARGAPLDAPVDVLVDLDVTAQRLVDVLVALDQASVRMIGLGPMPTASGLALRGRRAPRISLAQVAADGELDKTDIRRVVAASKPQILACYATALAARPAFEGLVSTSFTVTATGTVTDVRIATTEPTFATCVAGVFRSLVFPRPHDGEVRVAAPITLAAP